MPAGPWIIERDNRGTTVNGKPAPPRVYVTGPHFGRSVYSSTTDPQDPEVAKFDTYAEGMRAVHEHTWRGCRVVEQATAEVLS
jgi:hypothetical protein